MQGEQVDVTVSGPGAPAPRVVRRVHLQLRPQPQVTGLSESSGNPGDTIYIYGSGFTGASGVYFGGNAADSWQVDNDGDVSVTVPSGIQGDEVDVTVSGPGGTSSTTPADQFTYMVQAIRSRRW